MKKRIGLLLLITLLTLPLVAKEPEYKVKAALVEKITRFITWPFEHQKEDTLNWFTIAVLGNSPIFPYLQVMAEQQFIKNKPIKIIRCDKISQIPNVQVLFISRDQWPKVPKIVRQFKHKSVLLIGDTKGYAQRGVALNFYIWNNVVRFEINQQSVNESPLIFSSRLLRLAKIVK